MCVIMNKQKKVGGNVSKLEEPKKEEKSEGERYEASAIALVGRKTLDIKIVNPKLIEKYLLAHPVVPFGIDKKANRIINRSYEVVGGSDEMREYCKQILSNSGGEIFLKNWIKDAYGFGTSFAMLALSPEKDCVVKCVPKHPVYYGYYKEPTKSTANFFSMDESLSIVFDESTGKPKGFCSYTFKDGKRVPVKEDFVSYAKVAPLKFDTWGDEIEGISIVQYIHENIKQILNIEDAGAEQLYRNGFTQKKFTTNIRSVNKLKEFSKTIQDMNEIDAIVLLDGTDVENLQPGNSDFVPFHKEFLGLLSIALGIPTALLTLDGSGTNKSSLAEMRNEMYQDSYADELIIKKVIDEEIFVTACRLKKEGVSMDEIPKFVFKKRKTEVSEELELKKLWSEIVLNITKAAKDLSELGKTKEASKLVENIDDFNSESDQPIQALFEEPKKLSGKKKGVLGR